MFWFNKNNPSAVYMDIRKEEKGFISARPNFNINPDFVADFRKIPFRDNHFRLVVFDPPHLTSLGKNSWMAKKYGVLKKDKWRYDLKKGFDECWRVLEDYGILIFKWSTERDSRSIKVKEILTLFEKEPLFGHPTGKNGNTMWMTFMKIPEGKK